MRYGILSSLALTGFTAAAAGQTFSILAQFGQSYSSLPNGGRLLSIPLPEPSIAADGTVAFEASTTQLLVCRITPSGPVAVAQRGDPAPDSGGYSFASFDSTRALPGGRVLFRAGLSGTGLPASGALYLADESGLHLCLLYGQPVPGHAGLIVNGISGFASHGSLVTVIASTGPNRTSVSGNSLWQGVAGALGLLAHTGDPAVGMPAGRTFATLYSAPSVNVQGLTAFDATALPTPTADGLWTGSPGNVVILHQTGDAIPGMPGATFRYLWNPVLNAAGGMLFSGTIADGALHDALWVSSAGGLALLARQGDSAPGTGASFATLGPTLFPPNTVFTDTGLAVFHSTLTGPGVGTTNNTGIWAGRAGNVRLVARTGDPAPGFPAGSTFTSFTLQNAQPEFAADSQDNVVFLAVVNASLITLMVSDSRGQTYPLLASGLPVTLDATPGESMVTFSLLNASGNPGSGRPSFMNASGQIVTELRSTSAAGLRETVVRVALPQSCYANCDQSTTPPVLNVNDFVCFLNRFAAGDSVANCDRSTTPPVLNVLDFTCFLNTFAAGCP